MKPSEIFQGVDRNLFEVSKNIDELFKDYNKIKSVPENLADIGSLSRINIDLTSLREIKESLSNEFSLSSLAEHFKHRTKLPSPKRRGVVIL